jgi:hypothetical protein
MDIWFFNRKKMCWESALFSKAVGQLVPDIFDAHHRSPDRASSQTIAEVVRLSQARKAAGTADRHRSSLRTPELPNLIFRRRLGALKDLSPTRYSKDSRPAADVVSGASHAEERPVQHASMVDMQPTAHPVQLSHPNRSLKSLWLPGVEGGSAQKRSREGGKVGGAERRGRAGRGGGRAQRLRKVRACNSIQSLELRTSCGLLHL